MPTVEQDRDFFRAGVSELESYLLSDELFWPLSGWLTNLPRLTLGGIMLAETCLKGWMDTPEFRSLVQEKERIRSRWRSAWERKAGREVRVRLDLWRNYLMDFRQSPEGYEDAYPQEIRWRVMLHLLSSEVTFSAAEMTELEHLDKILKTSFVAGKFIWDPVLVPVFPSQDCWYLYGVIKPPST